MFAFVGAIGGGVLGALVGGETNSTAAVSEGVLRFLGGCLGAIAGAVIGAGQDIVSAIKYSRTAAIGGKT